MGDNDIPPDRPPFDDSRELRGLHFLTCRSVWFDYQRPENGFGLAGIYVNIERSEGMEFPIRLDRVFVYCQLWGDPGEYELRVRLVKLETDGDGEPVEIQVGEFGESREFPMPPGRPAVVSGIEYVDEVAFPIGPVAFPKPGLYEYQIWADGIDSPIVRERVMAWG